MGKTSTTFIQERCDHWWKLLQFGMCQTDEEQHRMEFTPKIEFSEKMTSTAGRAWSQSRTIKFSLPFMDVVEPERFDQTVAHELCHIFADNFYAIRCNHGRLWKSTMVGLGLPPERCHNYLSTLPRFKCPCGYQLHGSKKRLQATRKKKTYHCRVCKKPYVQVATPTEEKWIAPTKIVANNGYFGLDV